MAIIDGGVRQKRHYEAIHDEYEAHYYDASSMRYRDRFILAPLVDGLDLNDKTVLDVAAGSGFNTMLLRARFPNLRAVGLDISESACRAYERNTGFPARAADLTSALRFDQQFDAALVVGGLHHCVSNLPQTMANLADALRPGGVLLIMEPSATCWLEGIRRAWYRRDRFFDAPTEAALEHDRLLALSAGRFRAELVRYIGGPAYFAILNSLVLRVPLAAKAWLEPVLFPLEAAFNALDAPALAPVFVARWTRTP
jgi:SAM-dependent methyltransferase